MVGGAFGLCAGALWTTRGTAGAAAENGPGAVGDRGEDHGGGAEKGDLRLDGGARVDELREEGAEEEKRLRVAERDEAALHEEPAAQIFRSNSSLRSVRRR